MSGAYELAEKARAAAASAWKQSTSASRSGTATAHNRAAEAHLRASKAFNKTMIGPRGGPILWDDANHEKRRHLEAAAEHATAAGSEWDESKHAHPSHELRILFPLLGALALVLLVKHGSAT